MCGYDVCFKKCVWIILRETEGSVCAFMDLQKAYDRVDRDNLWHVLWIHGVEGKDARITEKFFIKNVRQKWVVPRELSLWLGCEMSIWLFNLLMDKTVKEVNRNFKERGKNAIYRGWGRPGNCQLLFADDKLQKLMTELGCVWNENKGKIIRFSMAKGQPDWGVKIPRLRDISIIFQYMILM